MSGIEYLFIFAEACICMLIINAITLYYSRKGLLTKIMMMASPPIATGFLLGFMFARFGFTLLTGVIFFVVSLVASLGLIWTAYQWLIKPIGAVTALVTKVAAGDLSQQITVKSKDEVGHMVEVTQGMILYLKQIARAVDQLSQGDLTARIMPQSEKDVLGISLAQMIDSLQQIVGQVSNNAENLGVASGQLASIANQASQSTAQISQTIYQVATGVQQQSQSAANTKSFVEQVNHTIDGVATGTRKQAASVAQSATIANQMGDVIQRVTTNAQAGATGATNAAQIAREGVKTVDQTIRDMQTIKTRVGLSARKVQELGMHSQQIGAIIETIDDIASQTNLLALNAAIEAARAGEHGKGFAVVADEVRKLAEQSAMATGEIADLIQGIQSTVADAVSAMETGVADVDAGVARANDASQALTHIVTAVEAVDNQVRNISTDAQQMNSAAYDLVNAMETVSTVVEGNTAAAEEMTNNALEVSQAIANIAKISEESSIAVEQVSASTQEMSIQVEEVTISAQTLNNMAQSLNQIVSTFKLATNKLEVDDFTADIPPRDSVVVTNGNTAQIAMPLTGQRY